MPATITAPKALLLARGASHRPINPAMEAIRAMSREELQSALRERRGYTAPQREANQHSRAKEMAAAKAARLLSLSD